MLRIRTEQMLAFKTDRQRAFSRWMAEWLRETHPAEVALLSPAEVERRVMVGLARAKGHGLRDERAIVRFVVVMLRVGPNFDEHPPFRVVLAQTSGTAELRFSDMMAQATADDWAAAQRIRDDAAWGEATDPSLERPA